MRRRVADVAIEMLGCGNQRLARPLVTSILPSFYNKITNTQFLLSFGANRRFRSTSSIHGYSELARERSKAVTSFYNQSAIDTSAEKVSSDASLFGWRYLSHQLQLNEYFFFSSSCALKVSEVICWQDYHIFDNAN